MAAQVRDGRSTRWDPHRRERRLTIINAAIAAIEDNGPDVLTGQIADRAGVPRTHVYRHFDGKPALDRAVSRHVAAQIGEQIRAGLAIDGSPQDIIRAAIGQHLSWIEAHPNLYRFLAQHAYAVHTTGEPSVDDAKAAFSKELTAFVVEYVHGLPVDPEPIDRVISGVVGMVDATASWWLGHRHLSRDRLARQLADEVWLILDHTARELGLDVDPAAEPPRPRTEPTARTP
jgi:AcrR family transcriptional regulator